MNLAIGLLLRPSGASDEQEFGIGADGLRILRRSAESADDGAQRWQLGRDLLDLRRTIDDLDPALDPNS